MDQIRSTRGQPERKWFKLDLQSSDMSDKLLSLHLRVKLAFIFNPLNYYQYLITE